MTEGVAQQAVHPRQGIPVIVFVTLLHRLFIGTNFPEIPAKIKGILWPVPATGPIPG